MKDIKKSKTAKIVGLFIAAAIIFTAIGYTSPVHAQTIQELQAQINSLLQQILELEAKITALLGEEPAAGVCPFTWTRDLHIESAGNDVQKLQQFLNTDPATQLASNGPGSPGEETTFFGPLTSDAVLRFQEQNRADILAPISLLSGTGFFGSLTRVKTNELCNPGTTGVQEDFNEKLRAGVIDSIGHHPIEGFLPFMFMQAFSGIVPQDFDGADALLGKYKIVEKELIFIMDEGGPINSAAEALSEEGMKTLFANIQRRANVLVTTTDEVDKLLIFLGAPLDNLVTECLPEQRDVDTCIEIFQPVCATVNVQCITTPCDPVQETFANSCKACMNSLVSTYTKGECPVGQ